MSSLTINLGDRIPCTESEGPGKRYAIWVQGCPLRCPGCCNPHLLEFKNASIISVDLLVEDILNQNGIEGITFVGGEPFSQSKAAAEVCKKVKEAGLNTMAFSGFILEDLEKDSEHSEFLSHLDVLIDGPYRADLPEKDRRWIGSQNQRIHHLSDALNDRFDNRPNTVEIKMRGMEISYNGYPLKFITKELRKQK